MTANSKADPQVRTENGLVVSTSAGKAVVRMNRTTRCRGCNVCLQVGGGRFMAVEAEDLLGVSVGDVVRIESREPGQVGGGFVLFIAPLLMFFVGYLLAARLFDGVRVDPETAGLIGGVFFFLLPFVAIALYHRLRAGTLRTGMRVVMVLEAAPPKREHPLRRTNGSL